MIEMLSKGDTLLIPSGTEHDPDKKHLFIICNDLCPQNCFLLVPVTSWTGRLCDSTTKLGISDHPFIRHESYILYRKSEIMRYEKLENGINKGIIKKQEKVNAQTLLRIINGVDKSAHTPRKCKKYFLSSGKRQGKS